MNATLIALSIPVFFLLIGVELWFNRRHGELHHRFNDSITDLSCGVGSLVHEAFIRLVTLAAYAAVWSQLAVLEIEVSSVLGWLGVIVGVDFFYYWFHRASHRVNFLWAGHVVHHQSEEYNLAVALRQSWYGPLFEWLFYLPLAVIGFSPLMYITSKTINRLYQFWIHTEAVRRLGPAETVLNTPSHHRVHHGVNPRYIDKNYAGIFITWDKLFGTFEPETEEVVYGTVKPLASWNPIWANLINWVQMGRMARGTRRWRDKLKVWLAPPEWRPDDLGGPVEIPDVDRATRTKYDTPISRGLAWHVAIDFAVVGGLTAVFMLVQETVSKGELAVLGLWIVAGLTSWGGLFERKGWAVWLDAARLLATAPMVAWVFARTDLLPSFWKPVSIGLAAAFSLVMLAWLAFEWRGQPVSQADGSVAAGVSPSPPRPLPDTSAPARPGA